MLVVLFVVHINPIIMINSDNVEHGWRANIIMMKKGKGQNVTSYGKLSTNVTRSYTVSECDKMTQN